MIRQADDRFVGTMGDPIVVDSTKPTDDAVRTATQAFAAQLEDRIRAYPQLWYQFYPYWSAVGGAPHT
jgi:predicted LPLAT superfamily acyltransferase